MTATKIISSIKFWYDVGLTEGSVEVPKTSSVLPEPDLTYDEGWNPSTDRIFTSIDMKEEYSDLMNVSYAEITYEFKSGQKVFYAWVDSVQLKSDTQDFPMTVVTFHIDLWRTFLSQAEFGYGMVVRRPEGSVDPIQQVPVRYRTPGSHVEMGNQTNTLWGFLNYTKKDTDNITRTMTAVIPLNRLDYSAYTYYKIEGGAEPYHSMRIKDILEGKVEETIGIDPNSITSFYISPISPFNVISGSGTQADPLVFQGSSSVRVPTTYSMGGDPYIVDSSIIYYMQVPSAYTFTWSNGTTHTWSSGPNINFNNLKPLGNSKSTGVTFKLGIDGGELTGVSSIYVKDIDQFVRDNIPSATYEAMSDGDYVTLSQSFYVVDNSNFSSTGLVTRISSATVTSTLTKEQGSFGSDKKVVMLHDPSTVTMTAYVTPAGSQTAYTIMTLGSVTGIRSNSANYYEHSLSLSTSYTTNDTTEWVFTDFNGVAVGSLPWGKSCKDYGVRNIITSVGGYVEYRFFGIDSHLQGTSYIIPLPNIDICSNSWSSYVYSGQRDYDIAQRQIAREQALVGSITGSVTSTSQMTSALSAGVGKDGDGLRELASTKLGKAGMTVLGGATAMAGGAIVGAGIGALTGGIDYALTGHFNNKLQSAEDSLKAKQTDGLLLAGDGWDWIYHGRMPGIVPMIGDQYSLDRFSSSKTLNGISVSEPTSNCTALINAGGPLQIQNLNVIGDIPIEAKRYIKNRFVQGVRLI